MFLHLYRNMFFGVVSKQPAKANSIFLNTYKTNTQDTNKCNYSWGYRKPNTY